MAQWEDVNGVSTEVGLSPGQTAGRVGGSYVERPAGSDTSTTYYTNEAKKEQNVYRDPQTQRGITADEAIRRGLEGGWRIGDTYYLTEQAARSDMQRLQAITGMPRASGAATPQEIMLKKKGYKAYTTIEGTTIYTRPNAQEIVIPKYGKMIPVEEFRRLYPTPFMKAAMAFSEKEMQLAEKLGLKGIIDPALKTYRHAQFLAEYDPKYKKYGGKQSDLGKEASEFAIGFSEEVRDKPLTAAGNFAFALLVTKGAGGLVSKVPALAKGIGAGKVARNINAVNVLGSSLAAMYGYDVTTRYQAAPDKAKFLGEITATELVPFAAGGYIGRKPLQIKSNIAEARRILTTKVRSLKAPKPTIDESIRVEVSTPYTKPTKKSYTKPTEKPLSFIERTDEMTEPGLGFKQYTGSVGEVAHAENMRLIWKFRGLGKTEWLSIVSGGSGKKIELDYLQRKSIEIGKQKALNRLTFEQKQQLQNFELDMFAARSAKIAAGKQQKQFLTSDSILKEAKIDVGNYKGRQYQMQRQEQDIPSLFPKQQLAIHAPAKAQAHAQIQSVAGMFAAPGLALVVGGIGKQKQSVAQAQAQMQKQAQIQAQAQSIQSQTAQAIAILSTTSHAQAIAAAQAQAVSVAQAQATAQAIATAKAQAKMKAPAKIVLLKLPQFAKKITELARKKKKKGKYIWDIHNPVPTLKQILGSSK